jgi:hypothetical protein
MDRYRIQSLRNLLRNGLVGEKRDWTLATLHRKIVILSQGAKKREKQDEAVAYEAILSEFLQEMLDVGDGHSPIRAEQGISSPDPETLVGLGAGG